MVILKLPQRTCRDAERDMLCSSAHGVRRSLRHALHSVVSSAMPRTTRHCLISMDTAMASTSQEFSKMPRNQWIMIKQNLWDYTVKCQSLGNVRTIDKGLPCPHRPGSQDARSGPCLLGLLAKGLPYPHWRRAALQCAPEVCAAIRHRALEAPSSCG